MENTIEVRYSGVVVGRSTAIRDLGEQGTFIGMAEPLPVGTTVTLKTGDVIREGRVAEVVESADPAAVGMRVRFDGAPVTPPPPARAVQTAAAPATHAPPAATAPETAHAASPGPSAAASEGAADDASGAIPAPMTLADSGGGRKRRKRR